MATIKPSLDKIWASATPAADIEDPGSVKYAAGWIYGEKPPHKWMNWLQNIFSKAFAHLNERGVLEHDLTTPYLAGAVVWKGNKVFKARQANAGQDTALTTYWQEQSLPDMPTSGDGFILYYTGAKLYWKDHQDLNYGTYEGRVAADKKPYVVVNDNTLGNPPLPVEINPGELALNFKERALYTKTPEGDIIVLSGAASIKDFEFTATAGQTTVTPPGGYIVGQIEVFKNGLKQPSTEYVANTGVSVVFNSGLVAGDLVVVSVWGSFTVANTYTQAQIDDLLAPKAPLNSPAFTGTATAVTPPAGTNNGQLATTAFVASAIAGTVKQVVHYKTGTLATSTALIPNDNTIPQISEGAQFMSLAITPKVATSKLKIDVVFNISNNTTTVGGAALFRDAVANAIGSMIITVTGNGYQVMFSVVVDAGSTAPTTFTVRAGAAAGTTTFNGLAGVAKYGGSLASSITITEIGA